MDKQLHFIEYTLGHFVFGLIKISIILFYKKLFALPRFRMVANVALTVVSLWMILAFAVCARPPNSISTFPLTLPS